MRFSAPAKLNLGLHVTGKRADSYHLLDSLVAFTDFGDVLECHESDALTLEISGLFAGGLPVDERNLVIRAARLLQQHAGKARGARMVLHKHIPVGAGLGGGSSDAAAALLGLCDLWDIDIGHAALAQMALPLGSDVPVCVMQAAAWISGVGEKIEPVALKAQAWVLLVNPGKPLLTDQVYKGYGGDFRPVLPHVVAINSLDALLEIVRPMHNDLQPPALTILPEIDNVIAAVQSTSGCELARMSGSGATCFGLYRSRHDAQSAAAAIGSGHPSWWCMVTRIRDDNETQ